MADKDTITKEFLGRPEIFADAFNVALFGGERIIDPKRLREIDTTAIAVVRAEENPLAEDTELLQKYRDLMRLAVVMEYDKVRLMICAAENQSKVDYSMPIRCNLYDAIEYEKQRKRIVERNREKKTLHGSAEFVCGFKKTDTIKPVITLVVNWSLEVWDGAISIHDMLEIKNPKILSVVPNYKLNLLDPFRMSDEQLKLFQTELMPVLMFLKYSSDKQKLQAVVRTEQEKFDSVSRLAIDVVNKVANGKLSYAKGKEPESMSMCKALQDILDEGIQKGIEQGIQKGMEQGMAQKMEDNICGLANMLSPEQIAIALKTTPQFVLDTFAKHNIHPS